MPRMHDKNKTKEQLTKELAELRQRIAELEQAKNKRKKKIGRKPEEDLREIIDGVKDGIVLLDLTGKVTTINKRITEVTGYTEEDIIGKRLTLLRMSPPKSIATMFAAFTHVISGQQVPPYEVEVYTKTGEKLCVEIHGSLLKKGGEKAGVVAVLRDVTERKQLETLLLRERETFVTILQHALYGVVLLDKDGKHVYVNPAFTAITGYTIEDIPSGRDWMHKAYPDEAYRQKVAVLWKQDRRLGGTKRVISVVCKNGETKEIEFRSTVLDDGRAVVMLTDVTERKRAEEALQRHREDLEELVTERTVALQATNEQLQREIVERKQIEEALRESEEKYRSLVESSDDSIYLIDSTCHYLFVNSKYLSRLGEQSSHVIGKGYSEFHSPEESKDFSQRVKTVLKTGTAQSYEYWSQRDNRYFIRTLSPVTSPDSGEINAITVISKDITERKQAEERLRESEEQFRAIFEAAKDLIFIKDRDLKFTAVNPAIERYYGVSASEMVGKPAVSLFGKEVSERSMKEDLRVLGGEVIDTEHPFQLQGNTVIQNVVKVPMRNSAGEIIGVCGTARDITEHKRMEKELRQSEERFKMLAEQAPLGISIMATDRSFEYFNPRFTKIFGYTTDDVPDEDTWFEKAYPDKAYRKKVISTWKRDIAEKVKVGEENPRVFTVRCKDGQDKIVDFRRVDLIDGKQYQVYEDITVRAKAEEVLRRSEEKYRELINGMNDTAWVIDFNGKFIDVNDAAVEVLGYSREELLAMGPHDIDSSLDAEKIIGLIKGMRTDKLQVFETTHTTKDGKAVPVEIKSSLVECQGKRAILSIARDITPRKQMEQELRESEGRFRSLVETMKVGLSAVDRNGVQTYVNEHFCNMLGYSLEEIIGRPTVDFYYDEEERKEQLKRFAQRRAGNRVASTLEITWRTKEGRKVHTIVSPTPSFDKDGRYTGSFATITDITDRKRMEEELRESEERYSLLFESESDAVMAFDIETLHFEHANRAALELYGYSKEELFRLQVPDISAEPEKTMEIIGKLKAGDPDSKRVQMRYHRKNDGTIFPVEITNAVFMSGGREKIIGMIRDITERLQAEETIRKLAYHDSLTGLPNRALFADRLNRAMVQAHRNQRKLAVMLLDLDHFKDVNDTLGHGVGDQLLSSVGKRLTELLRKEDTVSRMGGDEFFLLLPEIDGVQDAATIAQKVLKAFQKPFVLDDHELNITTSIGVAIYPDDGADVKTLLKHADIALYQAKQKGRNNSQHYTAAMEAELQGQVRVG
jgi:diguanylate cyclase (GGDEF)-like protein/PAS domain S-box-containing protein